MIDYACLQIGGQYEPGYFTENEENEEEEDLTDDPPDSPDDDAYASSFERWFNFMRRNRRNRRATARRSPNDDRDDVDGSENTASETDIGNLPTHCHRATTTLMKATMTLSQMPNGSGSPTTKLSMIYRHRHLVQCHLSSTLLRLSRAPLPARSASLATLSITRVRRVRKMQMFNKTRTATVTTLPPLGGMARLFVRGESQP